MFRDRIKGRLIAVVNPRFENTDTIAFVSIQDNIEIELPARVCDDSVQNAMSQVLIRVQRVFVGARMRSGALFFFLFALPLALPAQQDKSASPITLNDSQVLGRRVFQQRCAICHTESTPGARRYGPVLSKELVDGNEDTIRDFISNGSKGKMPGFKYGLETSEISAIVEYLKTVPRPAKRTGPAQSQDGMLD